LGAGKNYGTKREKRKNPSSGERNTWNQKVTNHKTKTTGGKAYFRRGEWSSTKGLRDRPLEKRAGG